MCPLVRLGRPSIRGLSVLCHATLRDLKQFGLGTLGLLQAWGAEAVPDKWPRNLRAALCNTSISSYSRAWPEVSPCRRPSASSKVGWVSKRASWRSRKAIALSSSALTPTKSSLHPAPLLRAFLMRSDK